MKTISTAELFAPVQEGLAAVEARLRQAVQDQHSSLTAATERLLNAGGKRIRPAICLMAASIFEADPDRCVSLAAAVEMMHTATLVHDDLIDGAALRRGVPTLNADWPADAIVLAGDYLFARAASLIAQTNHPRLIELFAKTLMIVVNGEIKQRFSGRGCINRDDYYERIYAKTAAMFVLATEAAATLGEADPVQPGSVERVWARGGHGFPDRGRRARLYRHARSNRQAGWQRSAPGSVHTPGDLLRSSPS